MKNKAKYKQVHYVYKLRISVKGAVLYKLGFSRCVERRVGFLLKPGVTIEIVSTAQFDTMAKALSVEQYLISKNKGIKYVGRNILPSGNTELFISEPDTFRYNFIPYIL